MKIIRLLKDIEIYCNLLFRFGVFSILACKRLPAPVIQVIEACGLSVRNRLLSLQVYSNQPPVWMRYQTSDAKVFIQIFSLQEYSCLTNKLDVDRVGLVIDAGANVGYSSLYFLNLFPNSYIVAVEPDEGNLEVCQRNLTSYGDRALLLKNGVWSHKTGLNFVEEAYRDGRDWAIRVEESAVADSDLVATDINSILENSEFEKIDLLKMDIERSEIEVFSRNYSGWLSKTKNIVIELHDEECEKAFFDAMSTYDYELSYSGELTVCLNIKSKVCA